jgi:hypothetical protein
MRRRWASHVRRCACAALRLRACGEKAEADERKLVHVGKPANGRNGRLVKRQRDNRAQLAAAPNALHARDVSRSAASLWRKREAGYCMCRAHKQTNEQATDHTKQTARAGEPANRNASQHRTAAQHAIGAQRIPPVPKHN